MESVEYEPAWSLGANCGNDDIAVVAKIHVPSAYVTTSIGLVWPPSRIR
jgi:hypothetical protein